MIGRRQELNLADGIHNDIDVLQFIISRGTDCHSMRAVCNRIPDILNFTAELRLFGINKDKFVHKTAQRKCIGAVCPDMPQTDDCDFSFFQHNLLLLRYLCMAPTLILYKFMHDFPCIILFFCTKTYIYALFVFITDKTPAQRYRAVPLCSCNDPVITATKKAPERAFLFMKSNRSRKTANLSTRLIASKPNPQ